MFKKNVDIIRFEIGELHKKEIDLIENEEASADYDYCSFRIREQILGQKEVEAFAPLLDDEYKDNVSGISMSIGEALVRKIYLERSLTHMETISKKIKKSKYKNDFYEISMKDLSKYNHEMIKITSAIDKFNKNSIYE